MVRGSNCGALVVLGIGLFSALPAAAEEAPSSYGLGILAVDAVGVGVGLGSYAATSSWRSRTTDPPSLAAYLAVSTYAVGAIGAPAVHWANGRTGIGFGDLGIRLTAAPLAGIGGIAALCLSRDLKSPCAQDGMIGGMLVGEAIVAVVDAAVLARDGKAPAKPAETWYGWQTLAVDGVLLGVGAGLATKPRTTKPGAYAYSDVAATAAGWYAFSWLAAPIVHFAHGKVLRGFGDAGLRLGLPLVALLPGLIGACGGLGGRSGCANAGAEGGFLGGMALVAVIDAFVLARDEAPEPSQTTWAPLVTPVTGGLLVGAMGTL